MARHDKIMARLATVFFTLVVVLFVGTKLYTHHRNAVRTDNAEILGAEVTAAKQICNEYSGIKKIEFKKYMYEVGPGSEYISVRINNKRDFKFMVHSSKDVGEFGFGGEMSDDYFYKGKTQMNDVMIIYTVERGKH